MLRVTYEATALSEYWKTSKHDVHQPINYRLPAIEIYDFAEAIQRTGKSKFPLYVSVEADNEEAKKVVEAKKCYLIFDQKVCLAALPEDNYFADKKDVALKRKCCFLRELENIYVRFRGEKLVYKRGMTFEQAMVKRKEAIGENASICFCWNTTDYGPLPTELAALCGKQTILCASKDDDVSSVAINCSSSSSNMPTVAARPIEENVLSKPHDNNAAGHNADFGQNRRVLFPVFGLMQKAVNRNKSSVSEREDKRSALMCNKEKRAPVDLNTSDVSFDSYRRVPQNNEWFIEEVNVDSVESLRRRYKISPLYDVSYDVLLELHNKDFVENGGHRVLHPEAFNIISITCGYENGGEAAIDWYSRNIEEGRPMVFVSAELKRYIATLDSTILSHLYQMAGYSLNNIGQEVVCRLCYDVQSHETVYCVRFPTLDDRINKIGAACHGCGQKTCRLGSTAHPHAIADLCMSCGKHADRKLHPNWLCDDTAQWMELRHLFLKIAALARATMTWNLTNVRDATTYKSVHGVSKKCGN